MVETRPFVLLSDCWGLFKGDFKKLLPSEKRKSTSIFARNATCIKFSSYVSLLLVADNGVWHIWLLQIRNVFVGQGDGESANGIFQVRNFRGPNDGSRHRLLL